MLRWVSALLPVIWNMKYILRHWVQFLSVKFCFCLFCWHITGKLLTAIAVWRKSVHAKLFWRTVETSFYSGSVEKIFPLKTFRRNCHSDFEDDIYLSTFYNPNGHESADWKCRAACCISGEIGKLKNETIYWNELWKSTESLKGLPSEL